MNKDYYQKVQNKLILLGFEITASDLSRPWGAFYYINEDQAQAFSDHFFGGIDINNLKIDGKLSPKILIVKPNVKLSWQYHNRRAEIWQVYQGTVGVVKSDTDIENEMKVYNEGDQIVLQQGERHRLIGLDGLSFGGIDLVTYRWRLPIIRRRYY